MGGPWERIPCIYLKCSIKYGVLKNSQNYQENICVRVSFLKHLQASDLQLHWKRDSDTDVLL